VNGQTPAAARRKAVLAGIGVALALSVSGCGSASGGSYSYPISVAISTAPPSGLYVNQTASVAAAVTNDSANAGVDWSCAPAGSCGSFSPWHTASGASTTYTAPSSAASVTITAASTKDSTKTAAATVTVTPISISSLKGAYTFYAAGFNSHNDPSQVAGSIVLDGSGNVTSGEQDRADDDSGVASSDAIISGTMTDRSDGRGTLTLTASSWGTEIFSVTFVNSEHLLITEMDSNATSAGSMDLQTAPNSVPKGGNAFAVLDYWYPLTFGGVITSDGTNITAEEADDNWGDTGQGSCMFTTDANCGFSPAAPGVPNAITAPDAAGRGTILLYDQGYNYNAGGDLEFAYYVVGPEAFRLVEIDGNAHLVGSMFGQGTGSFSAASLKGGFAFEQIGWTNDVWFGVAGQFTADGVSAFSGGQMDVNDGTDPPYFAADISGSTYGVNSDGYGSIALSARNGSYLANFGVYLVDPAINITDPNSPTGGGGALLTELDYSGSQGAGPGAGFAVPQQLSGATFSGNYAFNLDGWDPYPFDLIGQLTSDGTANLTGTVDSNHMGGSQATGLPLTGTFAADGAHPGRFTAQFTLNGSATPNNITAYQASIGLMLHVDMDLSTSNSTVATGVLERQQ
jgi:hypothetical protein